MAKPDFHARVKEHMDAGKTKVQAALATISEQSSPPPKCKECGKGMIGGKCPAGHDPDKDGD